MAGLLELDALDLVLPKRPAVVSVMWVNNETGVVFPIEEIAVPSSDLPGEQAWPTQPLPLKPAPFARQTVTAAKRHRPSRGGSSNHWLTSQA